MSVLDPDKTYSNLKKKGFVDMPNKSKDHKYVEFVHEGKRVLYTKISHGSKNEIGNSLIGKMSRQCKLKKTDFMDLANCPMKKAKYVKILEKEGFIDPKKDEKE